MHTHGDVDVMGFQCGVGALREGVGAGGGGGREDLC